MDTTTCDIPYCEEEADEQFDLPIILRTPKRVVHDTMHFCSRDHRDLAEQLIEHPPQRRTKPLDVN